LLAAPLAAADPIKGSFQFGQIRFEPVDILAFQADVGEKAPVTFVVVTSFKIDRAAVIAAIDPGNSLYAQAENNQGNTVMLVAMSPERCRVKALLAAGDRPQDIDFGSFPSKTSVSSDSRIAGECFTPTPEKKFDDDLDFHLSYDTPLTVIAKPTPLPAGGGEPGAQYLALVKAIQAADWDVAHLHVREGELPDTRKKVAESNYFENLAANYPKSATVTGGLMKGDRAHLDIRGIHQDGHKIEGVVALKKVGSDWRVVDQQFYGTQ
jgi:hypothetical protein